MCWRYPTKNLDAWRQALHVNIHNHLVCCWRQNRMPHDLETQLSWPSAKINVKSLLQLPINHRQRREAWLCPGTESIHHLLQHDVQASNWWSGWRGWSVRSRLYGSLFNLRRLHAIINTQGRLIRDHLFAGDAAFIVHTRRFM